MIAVVTLIGVVVIQGSTGGLWWAAARNSARISIFELAGMGLALGTVASMLAAMALSATPMAPAGWVLPALVTAAVVGIAAAMRRLHLARVTFPRRQATGVLFGLLSGLALLAGNWSRVPLDRPSAASYTDLYFFEALSRGLAEFGPAQSILMAGGSLRYHWFSYAWSGELAQVSNAAPFLTLTRVLPLTALIATAMLVAAWSARLSRVRWVPSLAVLLVVAGGYSGALYGAILNFDSPSQSLTTVWLLALAIAFVMRVSARTTRVAGLALIALLAVACTGGKVSHALVALGGLGLVSLIGWLTRAPWKRAATVATGVAATAMTITYIWVIAGVAIDRNLTEDIAVRASTWQGLDPLSGRLGIALGTFALLLAVFARLSGLGWALVDRATRLTPDTLFATGSVLVGVAAMLTLSEGVNELWFILAASAPGAVVSAAAVGRALAGPALRGGQFPRPLAWGVVVAIPASAACLVLSLNWSAFRPVLNWLAPVSVWLLVPVTAWFVVRMRSHGPEALRAIAALSVAGLAFTSVATRPAALWTVNRPITTETGDVTPASGLTPVAPPTQQAESDGSNGSAWPDYEAARWLVAHSTATDVIATTDSLSAAVPALTGRQMYLAGDRYQVGLGRADELATIEERQADSQSLATGVGADTARRLCAAGVTRIWFTSTPEAAAATGLPVDYSSPSVSILRFPPSECAGG